MKSERLSQKMQKWARAAERGDQEAAMAIIDASSRMRVTKRLVLPPTVEIDGYTGHV